MFDGTPVALGTAEFGSAISPADSCLVLDKYVALGGRVVDTANNYAFWRNGGMGGQSETVIGNWMRERGNRQAVTIMTKIGSQVLERRADGAKVYEGLSAKAVAKAVEASLERLKTDHIDILLAHHDHPATPLLETWEAFSALVASGKVGKVGVSNYSPGRLAELARLVQRHSLAPIAALQLKYSLIAPAPGSGGGVLVTFDTEMKAVLESLLPGVALFGYSPLLQGIYEKGEGEPWPAEYDSEANRAIARDVRLKAEALGVSPSAYVLKEISGQGIWPVTGTGKPERLDDNLALFRHA